MGCDLYRMESPGIAPYETRFIKKKIRPHRVTYVRVNCAGTPTRIHVVPLSRVYKHRNKEIQRCDIYSKEMRYLFKQLQVDAKGSRCSLFFYAVCVCVCGVGGGQGGLTKKEEEREREIERACARGRGGAREKYAQGV